MYGGHHHTHVHGLPRPIRDDADMAYPLLSADQDAAQYRQAAVEYADEALERTREAIEARHAAGASSDDIGHLYDALEYRERAAERARSAWSRCLAAEVDRIHCQRAGHLHGYNIRPAISTAQLDEAAESRAANFARYLRSVRREREHREAAAIRERVQGLQIERIEQPGDTVKAEVQRRHGKTAAGVYSVRFHYAYKALREALHEAQNQREWRPVRHLVVVDMASGVSSARALQRPASEPGEPTQQIAEAAVRAMIGKETLTRGFAQLTERMAHTWRQFVRPGVQQLARKMRSIRRTAMYSAPSSGSYRPPAFWRRMDSRAGMRRAHRSHYRRSCPKHVIARHALVPATGYHVWVRGLRSGH